MELLSSFTSAPLFRVQHGRREIGMVDQASYVIRHDQMPVILLAGRAWQVTHLDWTAKVAYVAPSETKGRSRWLGGGRL